MIEISALTQCCSCGVDISQGVIEDGAAFVAIGVHGATEAEILDWVKNNRAVLQPLLALSVQRMREHDERTIQ